MTSERATQELLPMWFSALTLNLYCVRAAKDKSVSLKTAGVNVIEPWVQGEAEVPCMLGLMIGKW